ncbi:hypothetical protein [Mesorhizobium sp. ORS 3428]|uniref:hypothetical protein n=1 Tax=Mesorhizobium sp. ORS 3428 TaxID=540997 RepID=UPI001FCD5BAE|nr:hypothetical protein [Mesorhizobium sp. ORS 3428]
MIKRKMEPVRSAVVPNRDENIATDHTRDGEVTLPLDVLVAAERASKRHFT